MQPTSVRIDEQLREEIKKIAEEEDRPFTRQISHLLKKGIEQYKREQSTE